MKKLAKKEIGGASIIGSAASKARDMITQSISKSGKAAAPAKKSISSTGAFDKYKSKKK
ncbi:MAG TPA: hypothetical protein PLT51_00230 [Candidatus Dojkabacteria bacterium]|nr:hypothetical protein [Candidatus Dojkabacteria bacterium]